MGNAYESLKPIGFVNASQAVFPEATGAFWKDVSPMSASYFELTISIYGCTCTSVHVIIFHAPTET